MTDTIYSIPFETGLNEVVADVRANAGDVRRSINYTLQAEGGYEWIGGIAQWSGRDVTPDMASIQVLEVETPLLVPTEPVVESESGVESRYIGHVDRNNTTLVFVEKTRATSQFKVGDYWADQGSSTRGILDIDPILTDDEWEAVNTAIKLFPIGKSSGLFSDGDVLLLHENAGTLYSVQQDSDDGLIVHRAIMGGTGGWVSVGTIPLPEDTTGMRLEGCSYTFAGSDPTLFITTGVTAPYAVERNEGGTDPVPYAIDDGVTTNPTHVIVHQEMLFLAYPGGRILHSNIGDPTTFTALGGGGEIGAGGEITGFQILPGDSLGIFCADRIKVLQGTSSADWTLTEYSNEAGAITGTLQNMPTAIFADLRGIGTLSSSDTYGNFRDNTLTQSVDQTYQSIIRNATLYSAVSRSKSQYRLINEDGRGLYLTFKGTSMVGAMEIDLDRKITAMGVLRGDEDRMFIGSNGNVYQLDYPYSTDNENAFIELVDYHYGSPRTKKRFSQIDLDVVGDPQVGLAVTTLVDGGQDYYADNEPVEVDTLSRSTRFYRQELSAKLIQRFEGTAYLCGSGVSQVIRIENKTSVPHTIKSALVHYRTRGQKR